MQKSSKRFASKMCVTATALALTVMPYTSPASADEDTKLTVALALINTWIMDGMYSTAAQVKADEANNVPENLQHNLMYQLYARVQIDGIKGITYFQQGSSDGTVETTFRAGILQFFTDKETGLTRQRELNFKDVPAFVNAYKDPAKIAAITLDDVVWDEACDFHLTLNKAETEIRGPIPEGTCRLPKEQFGQVLIADDEVVIRPSEYHFKGRYLNEAGQVMWGNESDVLNKMTFETPLILIP